MDRRGKKSNAQFGKGLSVYHMLYPETQVTSPRIRQHLRIVLGLISHPWMLDKLLVILSPSRLVDRLDSDQEVLRMSTSVCVLSLGWCFKEQC